LLGSDKAMNQLREEQSDELQSLIKGHAQIVAILEKDHEAAVTELRQSLHSTQQDHDAELEAVHRSRQEALDALTKAHEDALSALQVEHESITVEISNELATSEEHRRQLKMKANQAQFELSRIRDEHQLQHNTDAKQIADLRRANIRLEKAKTELNVANNEMSQRIAELDQRSSRKVPGMPPPQGPPPTTPLPPIPSTSGVQVNAPSYFPKTRSDERAFGSPSPSTSSSGHSGAAARSTGQDSDEVVHPVLQERNRPRQQVEAESQQLQDTVSVPDILVIRLIAMQKSKLEEELHKTAGLNRELADARKISELAVLGHKTR